MFGEYSYNKCGFLNESTPLKKSGVGQEATTEKISDIIPKKFSPTTNQPTNLIPHYKGVMCV